MKKDSLWHNKTLIAVCVEAVVLMMAMGHLTPAIPIFVEALGVEQAHIGLMVGSVIAAYGMARAIMDVPAGTLARRWGRRPLLIILCASRFRVSPLQRSCHDRHRRNQHAL